MGGGEKQRRETQLVPFRTCPHGPGLDSASSCVPLTRNHTRDPVVCGPTRTEQPWPGQEPLLRPQRVASSQHLPALLPRVSAGDQGRARGVDSAVPPGVDVWGGRAASGRASAHADVAAGLRRLLTGGTWWPGGPCLSCNTGRPLVHFKMCARPPGNSNPDLA